MSDSFLGRWSRRKIEVKQGREVQAEPLPVAAEVPAAEPVARQLAEPVEAPGASAIDAPPPPTLDDVEALTRESDFSRFTSADVSPAVKNAAMKKLFSDPHYNVMDGLDVYVGDYSQPDPIPHAMLRQLASAKFLGLFDAEEKEEAEAALRARDDADNPTGQTVAQSGAEPFAVPEPPEHADPDLRLQQDHADPGKGPGQGTG